MSWGQALLYVRRALSSSMSPRASSSMSPQSLPGSSGGVQGMVKHGLSPEEAASRFHILDAGGLIAASRPQLDPLVKPFARKDAMSRGERTAQLVMSVSCST